MVWRSPRCLAGVGGGHSGLVGPSPASPAGKPGTRETSVMRERAHKSPVWGGGKGDVRTYRAVGRSRPLDRTGNGEQPASSSDSGAEGASWVRFARGGHVVAYASAAERRPSAVRHHRMRRGKVRDRRVGDCRTVGAVPPLCRRPSMCSGAGGAPLRACSLPSTRPWQWPSRRTESTGVATPAWEVLSRALCAAAWAAALLALSRLHSSGRAKPGLSGSRASWYNMPAAALRSSSGRSWSRGVQSMVRHSSSSCSSLPTRTNAASTARAALSRTYAGWWTE